MTVAQERGGNGAEPQQIPVREHEPGFDQRLERRLEARGARGQQSGTDSHRYRDDGGDKAGHADAPAPRGERRGGKARGEDREPQDAGRLDERHGDKAQRGERHVVRFAAVDRAQ